MANNIKLNKYWDLDLKSNRLQTVEGPENDAQNLRCILKTYKGSDMFFRALGINWLPIIEYPTKDNIREAIKEGLKQYYKTVTIEDFNITEDKRERKYKVFIKVRVEDEILDIEFLLD